jgi:hypothetical protein
MKESKMIETAVIVFLVGILITWVYAGFLTGRQFHRFAKLNPSQPIQINWTSIFFQGLSWPGFWASLVGERLERRATPAGPDINELNKQMLERAKEPRVG